MADDPDRTGPEDARRPVRAERAAGAIPIAEERLVVERRERVTGRVRVDLRTETLPETVSAELTSYAAEVERVPVDRTLEVGEEVPQVREEDGVTIVPVLEEVIVVETRLVLREELRLSRRETTETVTAEVERRRQVAEVSRTREGADGGGEG